jgi:hypothetical protein
MGVCHALRKKEIVKGLGHSPEHKGAILQAAENHDDNCHDISTIGHIEAISHNMVVNRIFFNSHCRW